MFQNRLLAVVKRVQFVMALGEAYETKRMAIK